MTWINDTRLVEKTSIDYGLGGLYVFLTPSDWNNQNPLIPLVKEKSTYRFLNKKKDFYESSKKLSRHHHL